MRTWMMVLPLLLAAGTATAEEGKWKTLFDGKSFDGWKASENKDSWKIQDGAFVCHGPRSHLFYVGDEAPWTNFEFRCQVQAKPGSNAGIYFHTQFQESGWPKYGFEAQVNNSYERDPRKTGSLYAVKDVNEAPAQDNEWFDYYIKVEGRKVLIKINDKTVVEYTEPEGQEAGAQLTRKLDKGTFAFQAHDPKSEVWFRKVEARHLP